VRRSRPAAGFSSTASATSPRRRPSRSAVATGKPVRKIADAKTETMDQYAWAKAELFTIPSGDGYDLPAYWVLPVNFTPISSIPSSSAFMGVPMPARFETAGWGTSRTTGRSAKLLRSASITAAGYLRQEGRGPNAPKPREVGNGGPDRGRKMVAKQAVRCQGQDRHHRQQLWRYTTMMALTFGADSFNYGQAGSSVTDWRLYDSVYTERYMDHAAENPEGYKNGAVLTWASRYKGGLRITHGTIDDTCTCRTASR